MTTAAPTWTDNVVVQAPYAIVKGESVRATLDLRTKRGAQLFLGVIFGGSTDLSVGVDVLVRRVLNNDSAAARFAAGMRLTTGIDPGIRLVNNNPGPYAVGTTSFAFDGHAGRAAALQDKYGFWGVTSIPGSSGAITPESGSGVEILRTSKGLTTPWVTDRGAAYAHVDNEYIGLAESWSIPVPGGSLYEIIFDYGGSSSGEAVAVLASAQTYDSDTIT